MLWSPTDGQYGGIELIFGVSTLVEVVSTRHDWVDYAAAAGGLAGVVGAVAAITALIFAKHSEDAARRSAKASEESLASANEALAIMRKESRVAEEMRTRRADPSLTLEAQSAGLTPGATFEDVYLHADFSNTGTRRAEHLIGSIAVAEGLKFFVCDDDGERVSEGKIRANFDTLDGEDVKYWVHEFDILVSVGKLHYLRLIAPPAGSHTIRTWLAHEDIPGGNRVEHWRLQIGNIGQEPTIEQITWSTTPQRAPV
jgi:hypothetical protein